MPMLWVPPSQRSLRMARGLRLAGSKSWGGVTRVTGGSPVSLTLGRKQAQAALCGGNGSVSTPQPCCAWRPGPVGLSIYKSPCVHPGWLAAVTPREGGRRGRRGQPKSPAGRGRHRRPASHLKNGPTCWVLGWSRKQQLGCSGNKRVPFLFPPCKTQLPLSEPCGKETQHCWSEWKAVEHARRLIR